MRNHHRRFVQCSNGQIYGGDFAKFCGLLRIGIWTLLCIKVHIFWEGHKILRNLHHIFVQCTASQIIGGDFAKFCCLLRIYELYKRRVQYKQCQLLQYSNSLVQSFESSLTFWFVWPFSWLFMQMYQKSTYKCVARIQISWIFSQTFKNPSFDMY